MGFWCLALFAILPTPAHAWRSVLYPVDWRPPGLASSFETNKLIQDFSYAGYHAGEAPLPDVPGPMFNAALPPYNADASVPRFQPPRFRY